tara:strand:- start:52 stop:186 length:135 start_codon:yes stop_codon:yes gene_type:complete
MVFIQDETPDKSSGKAAGEYNIPKLANVELPVKDMFQLAPDWTD